jgi:hypothetical protein
MAVSECSTQSLQLLLDSGLSLGCKQAALARAAKLGNVGAIHLLLQHGAEVNDGNHGFHKDGPLGRAIRSGSTTAMEVLLQAGAHVTGESLMLAAVCLEHDAVQLLLNLGGLDYGDVALVAACAAGMEDVHPGHRRQWAVVELLLESGAPLTPCRARVALSAAASTGQLWLVEHLLHFFKEQGPENLLSAFVLNSAIRVTRMAQKAAMEQGDAGSISLEHPKSYWEVELPLASGDYCRIVKVLLLHRKPITGGIRQHRGGHAGLAAALFQAVRKGSWALLAGAALLSLRRFAR